MSLLLDALKKAEQSKREKVAEVAGGRRGPSGQPPGGAPGPGGAPDLELRLEPLPEEGLSADATGLEAGGPREPEAGSGRAEPSPSAGEAAGSVKSDPSFLAIRETVKRLIFTTTGQRAAA